MRFWFKRSDPPPEDEVSEKDETTAAAEGMVITQADVGEMPAEVRAEPKRASKREIQPESTPSPPPPKRPADESFVVSLAPVGTSERITQLMELKSLIRDMQVEARDVHNNKATRIR